MNYLLALDEGTTSARAIVFDRDGAAVATAQEEFAQHFPQPGWVEHDAQEIWRVQRRAATAALARAGLQARDVAAIGITNQRETTLVWDRATGVPVGPAIVWQDRRTAPICAQLEAAGAAALVRRKTGLCLDPYFSGTKLRWLLDHLPGLRARAAAGELAFGTMDTWLLWQLTGGRVHRTDLTNAGRTLLCDIHRQSWDDELLALLDIPRSLLPEIGSSSELLGVVSGWPELEGVPVTGLAGDQHAALFGQACFEPGMAKNTYGTGCFLLMNTGPAARISQNGLLTTPAWRLDGATTYALEGSVFTAGAAVQWLRDGLGIIRAAGEVEALARSVRDNGGVYFVPAFTGLGAPHWDAHARGAVAGLTRGSTAGHLARAALEAIAYQSADLLRAMERDAGVALRELRVDGGASCNDLLMQFQADLLQVPVLRPRVTETTALGAAYLAGLAVGFWPDTATLARQWSLERRFEPQRSVEEMAPLQEQWQRALERAEGWAR